MSDFRLYSKGSKRDTTEAKKAKSPAAQPMDPAQSQSLLRHAGGTALSSLHTIGSILSTPSRVLWGGINGLAGGEGGFGNMNPFDSTGGIELSHVMGNAGIIAKNDPTKWEWGDFGRGLVDIAGDPTSWIGVGGLTKAGVTAFKKGALTPGIVNSIRAGERGLLSVHHPLAALSKGAIGTGGGVADTLEAIGNKTRATPIMNAIGQSAPARYVKAATDYRYGGKVHPVLQSLMPQHTANVMRGEREVQKDIAAMFLKQHADKLHNRDELRDVLEGLHPGVTPHSVEMRSLNDAIHSADTLKGYRTGDLADDVDHFPRSMSQGIEDAAASGFEMSQNKLHSRDDVWKNLGGTNAINRLLADPVVDTAIKSTSHLPVKDQVAAAKTALIQQNPGRSADQIGQIAEKLVRTTGMRENALFGNDPLFDLGKAAIAGNARQHNADLLFNAISASAHDGPHGTNVGHVLESFGMHPDRVRIKGIEQRDIFNKYIPEDLAAELKSFAPGFRAPPAVKGIADTVKSLGTMWKAWALAAPASRTRDALGGAFQNELLGHGGGVPGLGGFNLSRNFVHSAPIGQDFSHLSEIKDLMNRHGLTSDEATRVALSVEAPRSHGFVSDTSPGQIGAKFEDIGNTIRGVTPSGFREVAKRALKSLVRGELDKTGTPIGGRAYDPRNVANSFGKTHSAYGPVASSNVVAGATDEFNRDAGILGQMRQGFEPSAAGARTRSAQVDYDPRTYTPLERDVLKQLMPFYSFNSRMTSQTAKELAANPGGRTAQLVKGLDRAQGVDQSIPDNVTDGTAIPIGESADGTKRFINNLGLMHEPAVKMLGAALGLNTRGVGYDLAGMLHPAIRTAAEHTTGQSFYQRGQEQTNLFPTVGGTLSNLGVQAGVLPENAKPISYPGSNAVEMALQLSPLIRAGTAARTLSDPRKSGLEGAAAKAANLLSGIKVTDVSPQKQKYELIRRAEALAKSEGAKSRSDVYFSAKELAELKDSDPKQYERQKELQGLLNALKKKTPTAKESKPKSGSKPKAGAKKQPPSREVQDILKKAIPQKPKK